MFLCNAGDCQIRPAGVPDSAGNDVFWQVWRKRSAFTQDETMKNRKVIFAAVLTLLAGALVIAGSTGVLTGTVYDENGDPFSGATIVVESLDTGITEASAVSDHEGNYEIVRIPPGDYIIWSTSTDYDTVYTELTFTGDDTLTFEPSLSIYIPEEE